MPSAVAIMHDNLPDYVSDEHFTEASIDHANIIAGDGTDHTYIDQDVRSTASPNFNNAYITTVYAGALDVTNDSALKGNCRIDGNLNMYSGASSLIVWTSTGTQIHGYQYGLNIESTSATAVSMQFDGLGIMTGLFTWHSTNDRFIFYDDIRMSAAERIYFRDTNSFIYDDGTNLTIDCDNDIDLDTDVNVTGDLTVSSQAAIGNAAVIATNTGVYVANNVTSAKNWQGLYVRNDFDFSGTQSGETRCIGTLMLIESSCDVTCSDAASVYSIVQTSSNGKVSGAGHASAVAGMVRHDGDVASTDMSCFRALNYSHAGTGQLTNIYGLKVENLGNTYVTNQYGVYVDAISGADTLNYAIYTNAGDVSFGDTVEFRYAGTAADTNVPTHINTPTGVAAAQATWLEVAVNGTTSYIPIWQ